LWNDFQNSVAEFRQERAIVRLECLPLQKSASRLIDDIDSRVRRSLCETTRGVRP
jgi:hypothetical protein